MAAVSTSTFPYDCVVLIESPDPTDPGYYLQGSGVVIGPHTILTASHVLFDISEQAATSNTRLYPGWSGANPALGAGYITTTYTDHFNQIGVYGSDDLTKAQSASDYAVIDTSYTFSTWMGVLTDYAGGEVHLTGYPASAGGGQVDEVGSVTADRSYSVLDYEPGFSSPGDSGGPIWLDSNGSDDVAGIVSTTGYACQLTAADLSQIESWVSEDGYSLESPSTTHTAPVVTAVSNVSLAEGQAIPASSLIASVSNPSGDDITEDLYEDAGGGSGYFTVNGVRQADGVWIYANASQNVQYVGGSSPGSDTLSVGIYDATTNSYSYASAPVVATTIEVGGNAPNILWRNTNGDAYLWNSNGSGGFTGQDLGIVGASWQIEGTGNFNGSGEDGILWRNTNGDAYLWSSNGSGSFTGQDLGIVGASWQIEGTGDFNGSGEDGILWRNTNGDAYLWNSERLGRLYGRRLGRRRLQLADRRNRRFQWQRRGRHPVAQYEWGCLPLELQRLGRLYGRRLGRRRLQLADRRNRRFQRQRKRRHPLAEHERGCLPLELQRLGRLYRPGLRRCRFQLADPRSRRFQWQRKRRHPLAEHERGCRALERQYLGRLHLR